MATNFMILGLLGLLNLIAFIWLVIAGFKRSILWGILIFLFSPLAAIIFAITNWFDAKKPFLAYLLTAVLFAGAWFSLLGDQLAQFAKISEAVNSGQIQPNEAADYFNQDKSLPEHASDASTGESPPGLPPSAGMDSDAGSPLAADDKGTQQNTAETSTAADSAVPAVNNEQDAVVVEEDNSEYPSLDKVKPDPLSNRRKAEPSNTTRVGVNKLNSYLGRYFEITKKDGTRHRGILMKVTTSHVVLERKIYKGSFTYKIKKSDIKRLDMFKKEYVEELS